MKKVFLFAFVTVIAFSGCKKDDESPSNNGSCTINGVTTSFTKMYFIDATMNTSTSYSIANYGSESENNALEIDLSNPVVGDNNFSYVNSVDITIGSKSYTSTGTGKITLTKKEAKTLVGTFSGTFEDNLNNEVQITGSFTGIQLSLTK